MDTLSTGLPPGAIPADQFEEASADAKPHEQSADIKAAGLPEGTIPADQFEEAESTIPQSKPINNSKALVEGMGRTMTFGATDALQHGIRSLAEEYSSDPDMWADSDKDVSDRKDSIAGKTGEGLGVIGGFMSGSGAPGLLSKGAKALAPEATLWYAKLGSAALVGAIEGGGIQAGDEISKSLLGQGDPEAPVSSALANIGYAGLIGGGTGALLNGVGQVGMKGLSALENAKMGDKAHNVLTGMGIAAKAHAEGIPEEEIRAYGKVYKEYMPGINLFYGGVRKATGKATKAAVDATFGAAGYVYGGPGGAYAAGQIANKFVAPAVEKILDKPLIGITNKAVIPAIMYSLSKGETSGLFNKLNYATNAAKGFKAIGKGVDAVLKAGTNQAVDFEASERDRKKILEHLDEGGVDKEMQDSLLPEQQEPGYAEGGQISNTDGGSIASLYPGHDMMLNTAKGRISNYLTSIRPSKNPPGLPFDRKPDLSDQDKVFNNAVGIAAAPLSILKGLKNGSIRAEDIKHFTSMYPELHQYLVKKFTEGVMNAQLDEEKLPYKTRQSLSLFMGTALDSTMTPSAILAAQAVFMPKPSPQQPQDGSKKKDSPAKLGKDAKTYKTTDQAAESDRATRE